jgi:phosphopantothenoylcysteine decarboxylase/phosphopantothenate--cysteine ligase
MTRTANENPAAGPLAGREVLLCVSGGIAGYKAADLASRLVKAGASLTVAMTEGARRFVAPLTFHALTGRRVHESLWDGGEDCPAPHIQLTDRAELMIVAPATANVLAKIVCGLADELVSAAVLAAFEACPVLLAPAMNTRMFRAPASQENLQTLRRRGFELVGPGEGRLACGTTGPGRMAEPEEIFQRAVEILRERA